MGRQFGFGAQDTSHPPEAHPVGIAQRRGVKSVHAPGEHHAGWCLAKHTGFGWEGWKEREEYVVENLCARCACYRVLAEMRLVLFICTGSACDRVHMKCVHGFDPMRTCAIPARNKK